MASHLCHHWQHSNEKWRCEAEDCSNNIASVEAGHAMPKSNSLKNISQDKVSQVCRQRDCKTLEVKRNCLAYAGNAFGHSQTSGLPAPSTFMCELQQTKTTCSTKQIGRAEKAHRSQNQVAVEWQRGSLVWECRFRCRSCPATRLQEGKRVLLGSHQG
jgi:hypothetical protein